ncbi:MAG: radical SAM protein [Planctomycetota bacterium]
MSQPTTAPSRTAEIEAALSAHPTLPPEAIFKEDLLRGGVAFSEDALRIASGFKPKSYFIFSFDLTPIEDMQHGENLRAPEEICLIGGPRGFRRTIVSVRVNPASPHRVELIDGKLTLALEGAPICEIELQEVPEYYRKSLAGGQPVTEVAPTIEWGYLIYLTVYRKCQYFGFQEECRFCDINENFRQQVAAGRPYQTVKPLEQILEALEIIAASDNHAHAYTVTGGSITKHLKGKGEADFYAEYVAAIEERFPNRWIGKVVAQALPVVEAKRFHDAGAKIYHPNYEVWDPELFAQLCPGKEAYVGRDEWIRRILDAAEIFSPSHVIPNFVAGIETAAPHGFESIERAVDSTGEGLDYFMSRGITPRYTVWCPEPLSVLGKDQGPAPLAYHAALLERYRDTLRGHGLSAPPGYGEPGIGKAVFSVSAFMDVL